MIIRSLLNLIFPPLCLSCKEVCETRYLCPSCWLNCSPPDPTTRCRHCFDELEEQTDLCKQCRQNRRLSPARAFVFDPESPAFFLDREATEGLAGFAVLQWLQLDWPPPDALIPMPDSGAIAQAFGAMLDIPVIQALKSSLEYRDTGLEENGVLLLFDVSNSISDLLSASTALCEAFPKRIYLLSLFPKMH